MTTTGYLQGYLSLTGSDGSCVEIINHCRTLSYLRSANIPILNVNTACEDCCCSFFDDGDYDPAPTEGDGAPWFDPNQPGPSASFLGLYGDMTVGTVTEGGISRRRLTFVGNILSTCDQGRIFGNQWIQDQLDPLCGRCEGQEATLFVHCGDDDAIPVPEIDFANPRPDNSVGRGCVDPPTEESQSPPILEQPGGAVIIGDTGARQVVRIRYVRDSYQALDPDAWLDCYGARVTFSFDLETTAVFSEPTAVCDLGVTVDGAGLTTPIPIFDEQWCRDLELSANDLPEECGRCGWPCACQTSNPINQDDPYSPTPGFDLLNQAGCEWLEPLCTTRETCITPIVPWAEAVPIISIEAGPTDVELKVTMWDAHPGLPDPVTCKGNEIYCDRGPVTEPALVRIPAGSVITLDGRSGTAELLCVGRQPAGNLVTTAAGTRFMMPTIRCGRRLWIAFDADCFNLPELGHRITVSMAGRWRA